MQAGKKSPVPYNLVMLLKRTFEYTKEEEEEKHTSIASMDSLAYIQTAFQSDGEIAVGIIQPAILLLFGLEAYSQDPHMDFIDKHTYIYMYIIYVYILLSAEQWKPIVIHLQWCGNWLVCDNTTITTLCSQFSQRNPKIIDLWRGL